MVYFVRSEWVVEIVNRRAEKEIESIPTDMQADFLRIVELIQKYGLEEVREPHVKHLQGKL